MSSLRKPAKGNLYALCCISFESLLHQMGEVFVDHQHAELEVQPEAAHVGVGRPNDAPLAVGDQRFRVQHGPLVLVDPDATANKWGVIGAGHRPDEGNIGSLWKSMP